MGMIPRPSRLAGMPGHLHMPGRGLVSLRGVLILLLMSLFGACAGGNSAPVAEQGERAQRSRPVIVDSQNSSNAILRADSNPVRIVDSQGGAAAGSVVTSRQAGRASPASQPPVSAAVVRPATPAGGASIQRGGISRQSIGRSSLPPAGRPVTEELRRSTPSETNDRIAVTEAVSEPARTAAAVALPPPSQMPDSYRVRAGDTLYSIAFQHELDYRRLAAANGLAAPYTIYVNQLISLDLSAVPANPAPVARNTRADTPSPSPSPAPRIEQAPPAAWVWPLEGEVVEEFSLGRNKGIDIAGSQGDSVLAASAGDVVFSGRSVQGAGDLIIIRHTDKVLSAYAHNSSMTVSVGDKVATGQKIAEVGLAPSGEPLLHFEIRREGDSVDPRGYLP